jgi:hypothetical protein
MGFIRALAEFAAAAANLHPDHRQRYNDIVRADAQPAAGAKSPAPGRGGVQSTLTTVKSSSSSTSTSSPPASSISTS